jgi:glycerate kinase
MKKCIVISDSFKGTLSSLDICRIAQQSIPRIFPCCQVITIPVADGGEGTVACFMEALRAIPVTVETSGPYGESIQATYARSGHCAIVEMACAAGLPLVGSRPNPEETTTYGVGSVIRHAIENGCTEILLGLGGSATNDGGCGCAAALGVKFYDSNDTPFIPLGKSLGRISRIDTTQANILLENIKITVMCDVDNPLCGPSGAAYVFAPQKGADADMVKRLDDNLHKLAATIHCQLDADILNLPGAGAAGGMGGGCVAFLNATLKPGIEAILDLVEFDSHLNGTDLVITGEGRIDSQSFRGKVISGITKRTQANNVPVIAIVGSIDKSASAAYELGVTAVFGINREAKSFADCADKSQENYQRTLEDVLRCIRMAEHFS